MKYKNLSSSDVDHINATYDNESSKTIANKKLAKHYNVSERTIRGWRKRLKAKFEPKGKVLIYDIETSRAVFKKWWTGKHYLNASDMIREPKIISIAWKWLGEDEVYSDSWDEQTRDHEDMIKRFVDVWNEADLIVGFNNERFDDRWLTGEAMRYDCDIDKYKNKLDIIKEMKRLTRNPSYSLKFLCDKYGVQKKYSHSGIRLWNAIEDGTKQEHDDAMTEMIHYNESDVISTEQLLVKLWRYFNVKIHFPMLARSGAKHNCPMCGEDSTYRKAKVTPAGTIQHIMECPEHGQFKISNREYLNWFDENIES